MHDTVILLYCNQCWLLHTRSHTRISSSIVWYLCVTGLSSTTKMISLLVLSEVWWYMNFCLGHTLKKLNLVSSLHTVQYFYLALFHLIETCTRRSIQGRYMWLHLVNKRCTSGWSAYLLQNKITETSGLFIGHWNSGRFVQTVINCA